MEFLFAQVLQFSDAHIVLAYLVIFLFTAAVEGEITLLLAGVLGHQGYLHITPLLIVGFTAAVLHDILFWHIGGRLGATKLTRILFIDLQKVRAWLSHLSGSIGPYIFISKFTWGLSRMVLIASGYLGISFKRLMLYSIPASLLWSSTLLSLGYLFSYHADLLHKDIPTGMMFLAVFVGVVIISEVLIRRAFQKRALRKNGMGA